MVLVELVLAVVVVVMVNVVTVEVVTLVVVFVVSVVETFEIVVRDVETVVISNSPTFKDDSLFPSSDEELVEMLGFGGFVGLKVVKMFSD